MNKLIILLPEQIYILRNLENQDLITDIEQYSIYYKNLLYPYREEFDIQIRCQYGTNLGNLWRIDKFPQGVEKFPLTVVVYDYFGEKLAEKTCTINIIKKSDRKLIKLLCIGDSMTRCGTYVETVANKISGLKTLGTRHIGSVNHEGRGGWRCSSYFKDYDNKQNMGVSPFLFPKGMQAKQYYGNKQFYDVLSQGGGNGYGYRGIEYQEIEEDMYYYDEDMLVHTGRGNKIENPEFEFSFSKYLERFSIETPDVVSILFGANEFQLCSYENLEKELESYLDYIDAMVWSIRQVDERIAIIINLPVIGSDQYSWGVQLGCSSSAKQYEYCIKRACEALIRKYDGRQQERLYICPMVLACSPETGFRKIASLENMYTDVLIERGSNWVHPCNVGYMQMGVALAGVVEGAMSDIAGFAIQNDQAD